MRPQPSGNQLLKCLFSQPCYRPWVGNFCQYLSCIHGCCAALLCFYSSTTWVVVSRSRCSCPHRNEKHGLLGVMQASTTFSNASRLATDDFQTGTRRETNKFHLIFLINKTRVSHSRITSVVWPLLILQIMRNYFVWIKDHFCWEVRNDILTNVKY